MPRGVREQDHSVDRSAVLGALAKFDEIGQARFLKEHGFRKARTYMISHGGKLYDAKAIVGVAHGIAHPDHAHLRRRDFHSGEAMIRQRL